jgi:hypothetical protein
MHQPLRREQQTTQTRNTQNRIDGKHETIHASHPEKKNQSREEKPENKRPKKIPKDQFEGKVVCTPKRTRGEDKRKMGRIAQDQQKTQEGHICRTQYTCARCREEVVEGAKERELTRKMPTERTTKNQRNKSEGAGGRKHCMNVQKEEEIQNEGEGTRGADKGNWKRSPRTKKNNATHLPPPGTHECRRMKVVEGAGARTEK